MILHHSVTGVSVDLRDRHSSASGVAQFFDAGHLRSPLREISQLFVNQVVDLLTELPDDTPELTATLRHLLAAKDGAVRCALLKMRAAEEG